jgi:hypothetical protein
MVNRHWFIGHSGIRHCEAGLCEPKQSINRMHYILHVFRASLPERLGKRLKTAKWKGCSRYSVSPWQKTENLLLKTTNCELKTELFNLNLYI